MPSVVIIHAPEDTLPARALAEKLRLAKLNVVIEKPPGEELRSAVKGAPVTLALWSPRSVAQGELSDEVAFARGKSKVFHVCMQSAQPPAQFNGDPAVNLTGWRGEDEFPAWRELAKLVTNKAGVAPLPPPAPRGPSGFFQPGRVEPGGAPAARSPQQRGGAQQQHRQPPQMRQAPRPVQSQQPQARSAPAAAEQSGGGGGRGMMIAIIALVVAVAAGGVAIFFWRQSQSAQSTSAAWEEVELNDASAIREFIGGDPGDFRDEAQAALAELEERSYEAASEIDTIEAFEAFLNDFPESENAIPVRGRIAELQTLAPVEAEALPPAETPGPDLVPPGTNPEASGGPAPITPPAQAPSSDEPLPTN